jgi:hypothetical protein
VCCDSGEKAQPRHEIWESTWVQKKAMGLTMESGRGTFPGWIPAVRTSTWGYSVVVMIVVRSREVSFRQKPLGPRVCDNCCFSCRTPSKLLSPSTHTTPTQLSTTNATYIQYGFFSPKGRRQDRPRRAEGHHQVPSPSFLRHCESVQRRECGPDTQQLCDATANIPRQLINKDFYHTAAG